MALVLEQLLCYCYPYLFFSRFCQAVSLFFSAGPDQEGPGEMADCHLTDSKFVDIKMIDNSIKPLV